MLFLYSVHFSERFPQSAVELVLYAILGPRLENNYFPGSKEAILTHLDPKVSKC